MNLLMTPLNLATFLSFVRAGEYLFGVSPVPLSLQPFKESPLQALATFWSSLCLGIVVWLMFFPPATALTYLALKPIIRRVMTAMKFS